jgi:hypothetical protein
MQYFGRIVKALLSTVVQNAKGSRCEYVLASTMSMLAKSAARQHCCRQAAVKGATIIRLVERFRRCKLSLLQLAGQCGAYIRVMQRGLRSVDSWVLNHKPNL